MNFWSWFLTVADPVFILTIWIGGDYFWKESPTLSSKIGWSKSIYILFYSGIVLGLFLSIDYFTLSINEDGLNHRLRGYVFSFTLSMAFYGTFGKLINYLVFDDASYLADFIRKKRSGNE